MSDSISVLPGFSRIVRREDVPMAGLQLKLEADLAARNLLAERFGLVSIDSFSTQIVVVPWRKFGLSVEGTFSADVVQSCVVSLEPVPAALKETFAHRYRPLDPTAEGSLEVAVDPFRDEPPEDLPEDGIDLGEIVAELLVLALDPYPKSPERGLASDNGKPDEGAEPAGSSELSEKRPNPFAVLKNLKLNGDK